MSIIFNISLQIQLKMTQQEDKRNVPQGLKMILSKDIALTKFFIDKTKHLTLFRSIKNHHRMLEVL